MNTTGVTEGPYITLKEETAGQLSGKEGLLILNMSESACWASLAPLDSLPMA
jgi:hypothetical protein